MSSQELNLSAGLVFNHPLSVLEYLQYFILVVYKIHPRPSGKVIHKGHKVSLSSQERILSWAPNIRVNIVKYVVSLMRIPCKFHTRLFSQYAMLAEVHLETFDPFEQSLANQTMHSYDAWMSQPHMPKFGGVLIIDSRHFHITYDCVAL